jgi:L-threonylcarbamoyladenylate synthase
LHNLKYICQTNLICKQIWFGIYPETRFYECNSGFSGYNIEMKIIKSEAFSAEMAVEILKSGGLVIFPTETMYGIGADATNSGAIKRLVAYKKRPFGKPFSIAVTNRDMAERYAEINQTARDIYKKFLPGPVTVISTGNHKLAPGVESETGTIGVRIPDYPLVLEIVKKLGKPITATSANASYKKRPYKIEDILDNISVKQKGLIYLIIDAGELPHNEPSTVIDTTLDDMVVLRQGEIAISDQLSVISRSEEETRNMGKEMWQKYEKHAGSRAIVFALEGPMGAGKTQFTKGLARAMGIEEEVVSPTYNLELDYQDKLIHIDAWRMANGDELKNLGFKKRISDKSVLAIEWAERVSGEIRKYNEEAVIVWVKIEYGKNETERIISWSNV